MDAYFDDEPGYRIRPDEFALPDISLTADEAAVVGLATRVWQHARLAEATTEAVRKLTALGVDARRDRPRHRRAAAERRRAVVRRVLGGHPGAHARSSFDYRRSGDTEATHPAPPAVGRGPLLRPLVRRRASTPTAASERIFRLSRVQGEARQGRRARLLRRPARHRRPRHRPAAGARAADRARRAAGPPRRRPRAAPRRRRRSRPASPAPTADRPGTGSCSAAAAPATGRRGAGLRRRRVRRGAGRAARARRRPAAARPSTVPR